MVIQNSEFFALEVCRSITLVLSTLQENERLVWTQLNTTNSVGGDFFGNKKVAFLHYSLRFDMTNLCPPPRGKSGEIGCSRLLDLLK